MRCSRARNVPTAKSVRGCKPIANDAARRPAPIAARSSPPAPVISGAESTAGAVSPKRRQLEAQASRRRFGDRR